MPKIHWAFLSAFLFAFSVLSVSSCKLDASLDDSPTDNHIPVTGISLVPEETLISLPKSTERQLEAHVVPKNASNKKLTFSLDNQEVASITDEGKITVKKVGNAVITIRAADGISKTVNLTVTATQVPVTSIVFEESAPESLVIGETYKLKTKVHPNDATNKELTYTADNNNAHVADDGTVTAQSEGTVTITVRSQSDPEIIATVTIAIKQRPSIELITEEMTSESSESDLNLEIKTLNGKLSYTPTIIGEESGWLSVVSTDTTTSTEKDTIHLKATQNKTVWKRTAYINFKDEFNKEIKNADGKKLEVKVVQEENKSPTVRIQWVDGIDAPSPDEKTAIPVPHVGQAKKFYWDDDKIFFWYEGDNTKWFNNRKIFYLNIPATDGGDSNQCWAKTASNMLHWWFLQNKENIDNYITKKNITGAEKDKYQHFYKRNSPDSQEPEKSYIAKTFRTKATNGQQGGYVMSGLAWYLYGNTSASHPSTPTYEGPALFKDVFNIDKTPIEDKIIKSKVEFETAITEALNSKKAIGLHMRGTNGGKDYAHGITLWGAVFDEEENIIAIYVVDNNHTENRIFPYGIYYRDGRPYIFNYPNNDFATNRYVGEVITLDKGEELWQDWFDAHP
ncbi:Ig-like domain-containing protein [Treponema parvum]|uniref:Ig-like domain-containing protein n=1 Tax=Treponema parvum TaxID=138851 RepID=A0A975F1N4_9SPIR|nr:IdeS/Mac family cysteine endopeptidase [Treponema parvum]QTQ12444.1 Ig-like domain-containing protein [Treponema parvum]